MHTSSVRKYLRLVSKSLRARSASAKGRELGLVSGKHGSEGVGKVVRGKAGEDKSAEHQEDGVNADGSSCIYHLQAPSPPESAPVAKVLTIIEYYMVRLSRRRGHG